MPIRRDPRTGRWFFRAIVTRADKVKVRIFGTPGIAGPYQDLPNTKVGARAAEDRAKAEALTGKSVSEPRAEAAVVAGKEERTVPTLSEYVPTFMRTYKPEQKPSERRKKQQILAHHLEPAFGALRLDEIRQEHVGAFVAEQLERPVSPKTVNNRLAVLSSLLKFAHVNGVIPKPGLRFTVDAMDSELVAVAMEDVDRLLAAATPLYRAVVLLGAEAGLRAGEIRGLQWTDIKAGQLVVRRSLDTDTGQIIAPKHNKARTVAISSRLAASLDALPRRGLWVCAHEDGSPLEHRRDLYKPIRALYAQAKVALPPKPIHCLRHTYGTELAAANVPLPVIQELMGHASIETTRQYIHVSEQAKRDAVAAVFSSRALPRGSHVAARLKLTSN